MLDGGEGLRTGVTAATALPDWSGGVQCGVGKGDGARDVAGG